MRKLKNIQVKNSCKVDNILQKKIKELSKKKHKTKSERKKLNKFKSEQKKFHNQYIMASDESKKLKAILKKYGG